MNLSTKNLQQSVFDRTHTIENIAMILGTFVAVAIAWILISDIPIFIKNEFKPTNQQFIARITASENIVRRKVLDSPTWQSAHQLEMLYLNDQIFTDENSSAEVQFEDQPTIQVAQNSLVVIRRSENQNQVKVERGTVFADFKSEGSIIIEMNHKKSTLRAKSGTRLQVQTKNKNTELTILEGTVEVEEKTKKTNMKKNEQTVFIESAPEADPLPIKTIDTPEPAPNIEPPKLEQQYRIKPTKKKYPSQGSIKKFLLNLLESTAYADEAEVIEWPAVPQAVSYDAQISKQEDFKIILKENSTVKPSITIDGLAPGMYYLRIRSVQKDGTKSLFSNPSQVYVAFPELKLIKPSDSEEIERSSPETAVDFSWEKHPGVQDYIFELHRDRTEKGIIATEKIKGNQTTRKFTRSASFFWRVGVEVKPGFVDFSPLREVKLIDAKANSPHLATMYQTRRPPQPQCKVETDPVKPIETKAPEKVQRIFPENTSLQIGWSPTRFESVTTTNTRRESLTFQANTSAAVVGKIWINSRFGFEFDYRHLQTKLFKKNDSLDEPMQNLSTSRTLGLLAYRWPLPAFADSYLYAYGGYLSDELPSIDRVNGNVAQVKKQKISAPTIGLGLSRALSEHIWIFGRTNYFYATNPKIAYKNQTHYESKIEIQYLFQNRFSLGSEYDIEFGKYLFADERYAFRRQSLTFLVGRTF